MQQVRLAGFGGQGIILAGHILGKAATVYDGREAVLTQAYGPEARGGSCSADVVISEEFIDYPYFDHPEILVIMSQEAYTKYAPTLAPGGTLIIDSGLVKAEGEGILRAPFSRLAEELGARIAANIVMLGFLSEATGVVRHEALEEAVRTSVKEKFVALNMKALDAGYRSANEIGAGTQAREGQARMEGRP